MMPVAILAIPLRSSGSSTEVGLEADRQAHRPPRVEMEDQSLRASFYLPAF